MWLASSLKRMMDVGEFPPTRTDGTKLSFTLRSVDDDELLRIPAYINADAAFSYSAHCVKPYRNNMPRTSPEYLFNKIHSKARQFIEQSWAMLVNRFRRWKSPCEMHGQDWQRRISNMIHASMILHNVCISYSDFASDRLDVDEDEDERVFDDEQWGSEVTNGLLVRDYLCAIISTQWKMSVSDDLAVRK